MYFIVGYCIQTIMITKTSYGQGSIWTIRDDPDMHLSIHIPTIMDGSMGVVG
jgi:hypothetical protein